MTSENNSLIDVHRALKHPDEDKTGKMSGFARKLAQSICEIKHTDGMVIALYGGWGYGKTTVLNFIKHFIENDSENEIETVKRPEILDFNPWWFSESNDLTMIFFSQLTALLKDSGNEKLLEGIRNFSKVISKIPLPYLSALESVDEFFKMFEKDIYQQKEKVEELLKERDKKILVVIDDIDRLDSNEIRQVFKLIKAVGDFPNIIYLIALDKGRAVQALSTLHNETSTNKTVNLEYGEQYLEKIIQFSYFVPSIDEKDLSDTLSKILSMDTFSDQNRNVDAFVLFNMGLGFFLKSPRDVNRLINEIFLTYPLVKGKVFLDEFILIESLRIFCHSAYLAVRNNKTVLTKTTVHSDEIRFFHATNLNLRDEKERMAVEGILSNLFPVYRDVIKSDNEYFSSKDPSPDLSIFYERNFNRYFTY